MNRQPTASELARQKMVQSYSDRIQRQVDRLRLYEESEQPALYAGGGRIRPLGAAGALAPRLIQTSGSLPVGTPVAQSQGLVGAMPAAPRDNGEGLREVKDAIAEVALGRGAQVGEGAPDEVMARYPYDFYWDETHGALYYWKPSTALQEGEWKAIYQSTFGTAAPTAPGVREGASYYDTAAKKPYFWDGSDWQEPAGEGPGGSPVIFLLYGYFSANVPANGGGLLINWATGGAGGYSEMTERIDSSSVWSTAEPGRFYLPEPGFYRFTLNVGLEFNTGNESETAWDVSAVRYSSISFEESYRMGFELYNRFSVISVDYRQHLNQGVIVEAVAAGDYIEVYASVETGQSSGTPPSQLVFGYGTTSVMIEKL